MQNLTNSLPEIETKIGYKFKDRALLTLAFVHRSFTNEYKEYRQHNERLEFLGDTVLGVLIAEYLYRYLPGTPEGELSSLRSRLVESCSCYNYINKLGVEQYVLTSKGEKLSDGRGRESILANLFEAVIGAIYLDGGLEPAKKFLFKNFSADIEEILKTPSKNWKALLQDFCQKKYQQPPIYKVMSETGPDHSKTFEISVLINHEEVGSGQGGSKKMAQQAAAKAALDKLEVE